MSVCSSADLAHPHTPSQPNFDCIIIKMLQALGLLSVWMENSSAGLVCHWPRTQGSTMRKKIKEKVQKCLLFEGESPCAATWQQCDPCHCPQLLEGPSIWEQGVLLSLTSLVFHVTCTYCLCLGCFKELLDCSSPSGASEHQVHYKPEQQFLGSRS